MLGCEFLTAQVLGRWFYLYLIVDLYSRKVVGFEVHDTDSAEHAAHLARRTAPRVCMPCRRARCCMVTMAPARARV